VTLGCDEFYSVNLTQDTLRGMKENAGRGFLNGGKAPVGYRKVKVLDGRNERNKLEPDPIFAQIVRRIFDAYQEDLGAKKIATVLNSEGLKTDIGKPWSNTLIYRILQDEVYTGTLVFNKSCRSSGRRRKKTDEEMIRVVNCHTAIINKKIFEKAQRIRKERDPKIYHPRMHRSEYLLSGLIVCGKCGRKMIGAAVKSSKYNYYRCQINNKQGKLLCDGRLLNREEIETHVIEQIMTNILSEENLKKILELTNK
jgi:site-specific DNA recombinase